MISNTPTRIVLLLAASVLLSGCALKPKAKTRFHRPVASSGKCDCFTCRNSAPAVGLRPPASCIEVACDPCNPCESAPFDANTSPMTSQTRPLYQLPEGTDIKADAPKMEAPALVEQESPVIKEVAPFESSKPFDLNTEPSLGGGSFKPLNSNEEVIVPPTTVEPIEAPKAAPLEKVEVTEAEKEPAPIASKSVDVKDVLEEASKPIDIEPVKALKPAEVAKPVEAPKPLEVTKPVEVAKPAAVPTPAEKVVVPEPESTFKPGQPFKPRKRKTIDSSWNDIDANFYEHGADESREDETLVAENNAPELLSSEDPVESFFGRENEPEAKPLPRQSVASGKVVLRANPVERSVVYMPPSKSVSKVVVPALRSSFKTVNSSNNWLRAENHVARTPPSGEVERQAYQQTEAPNIAVKQVTKPAPPVVEAPVEETLETNQPRSLAVTLRAIPMNETTRRQKAEARFLQHQPIQRIVQNPSVEEATDISEPMIKPVETKEPELNIRVASPPQMEPSHPQTARALGEDEYVTPPWRIK